MENAPDQQPRYAPHAHFVQFYKADEPLLNRNVASFLWDGLLRGDGLLVIATAQRRESIASHLDRLGADVALAERKGQLAMLDAKQTATRCALNGEPDWNCFQRSISEAMKLANPRAEHSGMCIYGEMVGTLWSEGRPDAAIRLEEYWNRMLHRGGIRLFCGYPIDIFDNGFRRDQVDGVLCAHSHLLPTAPDGAIDQAVNRAIDELLGAAAQEVRSSLAMESSSPGLVLPQAERAILWLRSKLPQHAEQIVTRARIYYQAAQASAGDSADGGPKSLLVTP